MSVDTSFKYSSHQESAHLKLVYGDNPFKREVLSRVSFLVLGPWSTITSAIGMICGIGTGFATIATVGMHKPLFNLAMDNLHSSQKVVSNLYLNSLKILNPKAKFPSNSRPKITGNYQEHLYATDYCYSDSYKNKWLNADGDGFIAEVVNATLKELACNCCDSKSNFKGHIVARLTYALLAISLVVSRVADGVIGCVAAALSFLTFGKVESINNLAYRSLQAPGIIKDFFYCTTKFINPWAGA